MRKEIRYMRMAVMNTAGAEQELCISILKALEQKRKLLKIKNAILKFITTIALFVFFFAGCALDSELCLVPAIVIMLVSGSWLALIAFANS